MPQKVRDMIPIKNQFDQSSYEFKSIPTDSEISQKLQLIDCNQLPSFPNHSTQPNRNNDILGIYLGEIGRISDLSYQDELNLFAKIKKLEIQIEEYQKLLTKPNNKNGKKHTRQKWNQTIDLQKQIHILTSGVSLAKEQIIEGNLKLSVHIAKKYQGRGLDLMDLIQEGNIGLIKAISRFDLERGVKFSTYASWWIQQAIQQAIIDRGRTIRLPAHVLNKLRKLKRSRNYLLQSNTHEPEPDKVAKISGMSTQQVESLDRIMPQTVSLDSPIAQDKFEVHDRVSSTSNSDPLTHLIHKNRTKIVKKLIKELPEREQKILRLRYGLDGEEERSLQEVGNIFNLSRERIRQILVRAFNQLKSHDLLNQI